MKCLVLTCLVLVASASEGTEGYHGLDLQYLTAMTTSAPPVVYDLELGAPVRDVVVVARKHRLQIHNRALHDKSYDKAFQLKVSDGCAIELFFLKGELDRLDLLFDELDTTNASVISEALFGVPLAGGDRIRYNHRPANRQWAVGARGRIASGQMATRVSYFIHRAR